MQHKYPAAGALFIAMPLRRERRADPCMQLLPFTDAPERLKGPAFQRSFSTRCWPRLIRFLWWASRNAR